MKFKTFTTSRGTVKIKAEYAVAYCHEFGYYIESDEEKYRQEMKLNKEKQKC